MALFFNPSEVWQPFGAFSMAVAEGEGQILHLKGQVPLDENGELVGAGDMRAQVRQTLENIRIVLASGMNAPLLVSGAHDIGRLARGIPEVKGRSPSCPRPRVPGPDGDPRPALPGCGCRLLRAAWARP